MREEISVSIPYRIDSDLEANPVLDEVGRVKDFVMIHLSMREFSEYERLQPNKRDAYIEAKAMELILIGKDPLIQK